MNIEFYRDWYSGINGDEKLPNNVTTLYLTRIIGELPNNGTYNGPINYKLNYSVRANDLHVFVDNVEYPSNIVFGDVIHVDGPASGNYIYVNYSPLSDSYYFGDNTDKLEKGTLFVAKFRTRYITNLLYKLTQIEYVLGLPITRWYNQFIDAPNMENNIDISIEPFILYKIEQKMNDIISYMNQTFQIIMDKFELNKPNTLYRFDIHEINKIRIKINNIQTYLTNYYGNL